MNQNNDETSSDSSESINDSIDDEEFTVEKILDRRQYNGEVQYLVKWLNYTDEDNTWERAKDLECDALKNSFESEQSLKRGQDLNSLYERKAKRLKIDPSLVMDNPFNHDLEAQQILKAFKNNGEMSFLIKFFDLEEPQILPCSIAYMEIPQMVLKFYEKHCPFEDSRDFNHHKQKYLNNYNDSRQTAPA
ncbi:chromobox protein homolog 3 [Drosophila rhopaloa]|uniref:Chromobox protein homolog 3 n=1 Tax=Drosophila rhopaloa TaxID=1041015 RepID=A0A6P4F8K1_DRORH|nr:chromobox protein homolog 3 [Drosophila rhopaloa]